MKNVYYLTKTIVSLPCMGMVPLGFYLVWLGMTREDYGVVVLFIAAIAAYVWFTWNFCSPVVNQAFIKSAESSNKFLTVNTVITAVLTFLILFTGISIWTLLMEFFVWLEMVFWDHRLSEFGEFLWIYVLANSVFQISYLLCWEYLRRYRWVRRLTVPNVCW